MRLRVERRGAQVRTVIREHLFDVAVVGDRNLAERDFVLLHGSRPTEAPRAAKGITPGG